MGDRPVAGVLTNSASFAASSIGDAIGKVALAASPLLPAIALRSAFLFLLFTPAIAMAAMRGQPVLRTSRPFLHLTRASLHLASTFAGWSALPHLPLTTYTAIMFIAPAFIALSAIPILGDRIRPHQAIAIALGFAGCFIILRPSGEGQFIHLVLALASAALWAVSVAILRLLTRTESHLTTLIWGNILPLFVIPVVSLSEWRQMEPWVLAMILALAPLQLAGQWFTMTALRMAPAATVAPAQFTQLFWATLIGVAIFREWPGPSVWIGSALIVAGGFWLLRSSGEGRPT